MRISPREGRLLRLPVPCLLLIDGTAAEVCYRRVEMADRESLIVYTCRGPTLAGELRVTVAKDGGEQKIEWHAMDVCVELTNEQVEVFVPS